MLRKHRQFVAKAISLIDPTIDKKITDHNQWVAGN